jgi:hypothetical protein
LLSGALPLGAMHSGLTAMDKFEGQQLRKLFSYQMVMRTILRVNSRCSRFCVDAPPSLRLGLDDGDGLQGVVCEYLGKADLPRWHGASYEDIWTARVLPAQSGWPWAPEDVLPVPDNPGTDVVYVKIGVDFWDLPW